MMEFLFKIKFQTFRVEALLKRDSNTGVFFWILRIFKEQIYAELLQTDASENQICFIKGYITLKITLKYRGIYGTCIASETFLKHLSSWVLTKWMDSFGCLWCRWHGSCIKKSVLKGITVTTLHILLLINFR